MRRLPILIAVVLGLIPGSAAAATTVHVGGGSLSFTQADVTIGAGDTIHWVWDGSGHSVTAGSVPPAGNGVFDTGVQSLGFTHDETFLHPGVYHYFCSVHYALGMVGTITVTGGPDPAPTAAFTAPASAVAGTAVQFDASGSGTSDGDAFDSYTWDFGDGSTQTTTTPIVAHTYATAATPSVTLTVTDAGSQHAEIAHALTITPAPAPTPTPTPTPQPQPAPRPSLRALKLHPSRFCVRRTKRCRTPGTRITFTLSAAARVTLTVSHRHHTDQRTAIAGHRGANTLHLAGGRLRPGRYTLTLTPDRGRSVSAAFSVL